MASSLNPLRCGGTSMPVPLLLMAKIVAVCLLLTNHVRLMPDPFLPFLTVFEGLPYLQIVLKTVFLVSAVLLLFNRWVRVNAFLLGATILVAVLSSRAYYGNNKTFTGLLLVFASVCDAGPRAWPIRVQMMIVYFGAGLNKLLDADWQSGQFFEHWASARIKNPVYLAISPMLPPLVAGKIMCWFTIVAELCMPAMFAIRHLALFGIWTNILFQSGLMIFTGTTFTMFFYAMNAAMLAFVPWPQSKVMVIWDGDCGFCAKSKEWVERFDLEQLIEWHPLQSGIGARFGISMDDLTTRLHLVADGRIYTGFRAFRYMAFTNPLTWLLIAVLISAAPENWPDWRRAVVICALFFFSPVFAPVGERLYDMVARNRHKLMPNSTCRI